MDCEWKRRQMEIKKVGREKIDCECTITVIFGGTEIRTADSKNRLCN